MKSILGKAILGLLLLAGLLLASGCQTWRGYVYSQWPSMMTYAGQLADMDDQELEAAFEDAHADWERRTTPENWARLGLARGQPGYPDYKPASAAENLRTALESSSAHWDSATRAYLQQRLGQLQNAAQREARLEMLEQENGQLRQHLDDAQGKLRALTDIERDLGSDNNR